MNPHQQNLELARRYTEGIATAEETRALEAAMRTDAAFRRQFLRYANVDAALGSGRLSAAPVARTAQVTQRPARFSWLQWRPLTAAAAGLVIGLFSASMVWAYVGPYAGKAVTLLQESFESGPPPLVTGIPVEAGRWSGDYSEVVGEYRGVKPASGGKMLRFLRADYEGKPRRDGYIADVFRIVDLRDSRLDVASGNACVAIEARFHSMPQDGSASLQGGISLYALDALPEPDERHEFLLKPRDGLPAAGDGTQIPGAMILATTTRREMSKSSDNSWQVVRSELRMPPGARFLLVHLHGWVIPPRGQRVPQPAEFAGLFVDDVRLTFTHRPPLP